MAELSPSSSSGKPFQTGANFSPPKPQNPALRMLGLPKLRMKLPSRNWIIFLSITGSFVGALIYDRRQKRHVQQKWANLVAHVSKEPLPINQTRRKLTIFLSAPPGDGLRSAREHFQEYVKPVLVSGALDYEVVEGRKEGDIRAALANRIRKSRRQGGEGESVVDEDDPEYLVMQIRRNLGIHEEPGIRGDMVVGRHTWKEYVRGLHEGWLGPLEPTLSEADAIPTPTTPTEEASPKFDSLSTEFLDDGSPVSQSQTQENKEPTAEGEPEKSKSTGPAPAYILPSRYRSQTLPSSIPEEFHASSPIAFPHILGFLNTPIRIYRFLTKRYLADIVGRDVAAVVLATSIRPYNNNPHSSDSQLTCPVSTSPDSMDTSTSPHPVSTRYEQQSILEHEEKEWHKSVRKETPDNDGQERVWLNEVVIDPRIGSRMRRFFLSLEEEDRAQRIGNGEEWVLGEEKPLPVPIWKRLWNGYGWGEENKSTRVILGNLGGEDGE